MKKLLLIPLAAMLTFCAGKKDLRDTLTGKHTIENTCPKEGLCNFEVFENKSLTILRDDIGKTYYRMDDSHGKMVVKYTYTKTVDTAYQDGAYSEEFVFETDNKSAGEEMAVTKMLFGVHCFCRGKAGYYIIEKTPVTYKNNRLEISLPNMVEEQQIKGIKIKFK